MIGEVSLVGWGGVSLTAHTSECPTEGERGRGGGGRLGMLATCHHTLSVIGHSLPRSEAYVK